MIFQDLGIDYLFEQINDADLSIIDFENFIGNSINKLDLGQTNGDLDEWERDLDVYIPEPQIDKNLILILINELDLGETDRDLDELDRYLNIPIPEPQINRERYNKIFFLLNLKSDRLKFDNRPSMIL